MPPECPQKNRRAVLQAVYRVFVHPFLYAVQPAFTMDKQTPTLHLVWKKLRETFLVFCSGSRRLCPATEVRQVPAVHGSLRADGATAELVPPSPSLQRRVQHGALARRLAGTRAAAGPDGTEARGSAPRAGGGQPALRR